jgi:integrase
MRAGGAGRRWDVVDQAVLQRHDLGQLQAGNAPLVKTLDALDGLTFSVDLRFLAARPELARVLANSFWMIYQPRPRRATADRTTNTLKLLHRFLNYRSQSQSDVQSARDLSTDLLKEFAVWLVTKRRLKRKSAAGLFAACCCFLRRARRLYPKDFDAFFSTPKNLFAGADNDRTESRALSLSDFRKILLAAESDIRRIREKHQPGDVPKSAQHLVPFMVMIAARTGINPKALYDLDRDCLRQHELDENLFYCTWDKPRAGKPQRQLHRVDNRNQTGVVELIRFVRQFTEPLAAATDPPTNTKLFLYFGQCLNLKCRLIWPGVSLAFQRHFHEFAERHRLPRFTLANIRPTAATQLYLETGGNLRKVQQFLQHANMRTTVNYLLNTITEPFNARAIQKAQERMVERVTVIPENRSTGVQRLDLPKVQAQKIVAGRFDTGCGTCRNPYDSPQPGEEKGRPCTSFHACFGCPNGLWFLEDLPQVIAIRDRLLSLRPDMRLDDWATVYGDSVRIIEEHIIAAFRPEHVRAAEVKAKGQQQRPIIGSKGVLI